MRPVLQSAPWYWLPAHEFYPGLELGSHNGYLSLLAETGIVGTIPVLILFVLGLAELIRQARAGKFVGKVGTSLVVAYLFHCFFERYVINFGNPTSILVIVFLFVPRTRGCTGRVVAWVPWSDDNRCLTNEGNLVVPSVRRGPSASDIVEKIKRAPRTGWIIVICQGIGVGSQKLTCATI